MQRNLVQREISPRDSTSGHLQPTNVSPRDPTWASPSRQWERTRTHPRRCTFALADVYLFPDRALRYVSFFGDRISCASERNAVGRDPVVSCSTQKCWPLSNPLPRLSPFLPSIYRLTFPQSAKDPLSSLGVTTYVNTFCRVGVSRGIRAPLFLGLTIPVYISLGIVASLYAQRGRRLETPHRTLGTRSLFSPP